MVPVACMGIAVVRRKPREPGSVLGAPAALAVFVPLEWLGTSEYQLWAAWAGARRSWAEENLPDGMATISGPRDDRLPRVFPGDAGNLPPGT